MNQGPPDRLLRSLERYLRDATRADLEDFLADRLARRSAATAATRYRVLRVLYRWLEEEEDVPNPMEKMRPPIQPEQPVRLGHRAVALVAQARPTSSLSHPSPPGLDRERQAAGADRRNRVGTRAMGWVCYLCDPS
jgi:integrase